MSQFGNLCPILFATVIVAGCSSIETPLDDGYQFGDLGEWREQYCQEPSPVLRSALLALAARRGLKLPAEGICTDPMGWMDAGTLPDRA